MAAQALQSSLNSTFHTALQSSSQVPGNRTCLRAALPGASKGGFCLPRKSLGIQRDRSITGVASTSFFGQGLSLKSIQRQRNPIRSRQATSAVLTESETMEIGTRAPDFALPDPLTGKTVSLDDLDGAPALLVIFMCNHCPYVIHLKDAIKELTDEYIRKGLSVVAISSNSVKTHPQDGPEKMAAFAKENGYDFPYLYDETQEVAKAYKAVCTPEFYVFKKDGRRPFELAYHGRFDETRPRSGQTPTGKDLRNALDCVLSGRPVSGPQRPSIGCSIKWHPEE